MLIDRYPVEDVFARVPEVAAQTDPILKALDSLLEDDALYQAVRTDLGKRYQYTLVHGRHSTPVEFILRLLLLKHLYGWSYEETTKRVADSLVLRWFCRVYFQTVPTKATLIRWTHTLRPETLHALNDRVVQLAVQAKVTEGRKLRLDATCVQTEIHHPTDSGLLVDSVRVLSRVAQRAKGLLQEQVKNVQQLCRSRLRTARRTAQTLHRGLRRKGEDKEAEQKKLYEKLVETTEQMVKQVKKVVGMLNKETQEPAIRLVEQAEQMVPLVERVIAQTRKRVLENRSVPSSEKVLSLFEPHTRAIPRHKGGALVEFGRLVTVDEVEGGIVTRYQILEHPEEHGQAIEAVAHHQEVFARPPQLVAADRGVHSADTEEKLKVAGVKQVAIPAVGKASEERKALERTPRFRRGYRWRAGIEGRIASLRRDYGWRKSRYHGREGMERWLGLGVMASNLRRIALLKGA
ncbi:MAG TPA: ISNCY family transposase [Ktedonobacteraceae bacterium]|nr:ISNCY family transposase [Ktedonobacteraceae bacterium]